MFPNYYRFQEEAPNDGGEAGGANPVATDPAPSTPPADPPPNDPPANLPVEGGQEAQNFIESLPEEWRQQAIQKMGVEDEGEQQKMLNTLNRYPTFDKVLGAFFEQRNTIKAGQHKSGLPDNPTDQQLAEYREANGIPEKAEDYSVQLSDGLVLSDADERVMAPVYQVAHANNIPSSVVNDLTNTMLQARQQELEAEIAQHGIDQQQATRQLKEAWGSDYESNRNVIRGMFNGLPESVRDNVLQAMTADGKLLFNQPEFMVWAADIGRKLNPSATVVPNSANPIQSINEEIAELEAFMRDNRDEWFKDAAKQKRYDELLVAAEELSRQGE